MIKVICTHRSDRMDKYYKGTLRYREYRHRKNKAKLLDYSGNTWEEGPPTFVRLEEIVHGSNRHFSTKNVKLENYKYRILPEEYQPKELREFVFYNEISKIFQSEFSVTANALDFDYE